ncbi:MAG: hypothetical protein IKV76_09845, partial [Clostridia bacterium]|nr:hypothetical protein [Clostridia bacterium]
ELAFAGKPADPRKCISVPFADDSLVVITPNNKRFQKMIGKPFPIIMLLLEPFISREKGSGTRMETESFLRSAGYDPKDITTVIETDSTQSIINHVSEGAGISIISSAASKEYASQGKILQFNPGGCSIDRHLYIIRRRHSTLSPSAKEFYKFVTALPHNKDA